MSANHTIKRAIRTLASWLRLSEDTADDGPSDEVIAQRVHNRIMEYLELVASREEQLQYERAVPFANVVAELFNQWEDWVPFDDPAGEFQPPAFAPEEQHAICEFHAVWDRVAEETPDSVASVEEFQATSQWVDLRDAAERALAVFQQRGFLPED